MKALDFFCGTGGLTRGLAEAGIRVIAGFDKDPKCRQAYEHNNPGSRFVHTDMRNLRVEDLKTYGVVEASDEMLFAACAPCQPFSSQRKGGGPRKDATLLGEFGRLIECARPGQILMENVPGIGKVAGFSTFKRFLRTLELCGYDCIYDVLDAKRYGVPQNRRRLILLAFRGTKATLPAPTHGKSLLPYSTVREAIFHFPPLRAGECHADVPNHVAAAVSPINLDRLRRTPHDGGDRRAWPKRLVLECHKGDHRGHTDVYGRMAWGKPSPALTGRCSSISNGRYGHPTQDRAISLREAAALQSFPDDYVFFGFPKHIALQIGNALPVRLAEVFGKHILTLRGKSAEPEGGSQ